MASFITIITNLSLLHTAAYFSILNLSNHLTTFPHNDKIWNQYSSSSNHFSPPFTIFLPMKENHFLIIIISTWLQSDNLLHIRRNSFLNQIPHPILILMKRNTRNLKSIFRISKLTNRITQLCIIPNFPLNFITIKQYSLLQSNLNLSTSPLILFNPKNFLFVKTSMSQ